MPESLAGALSIVVVLFTGPALVVIASWLSNQAKTKRIIAEARLLEAKNAAAKEKADG